MIKRISLACRRGTAAVALVAATLVASVATAAAGWTIFPSPSPAPDAKLLGAAVLGTTDAWAVGQNFAYSNSDKALILRFNGTSWSQVTVPDSVNYDEGLNDVSFVSANDGWAVGENRRSNNGAGQPILGALSMHWNGSSWTKVTVPLSSCTTCSSDNLRGVATVSTNDVWAVGRSRGAVPLIAHYNGSTWQLMASPVQTNSALNDVSASAANSVWAVGTTINGSANSPLLLRYDGVSWQSLAAPTSSVNRVVEGVVALSLTDVWAAGSASPTGDTPRPYILHWNGTTWQEVPAPLPSGTLGLLTGITAVSATDIWAVGQQWQGTGVRRSLTMRWNGTAWSVVSSPNTSPTIRNELLDVAVHKPSGHAWAVGIVRETQVHPDTLTMRYTPQ